MTPRVVVLTPYFHPVIGGVESNAERFARFLVGAGIPVQVVTKRLSSDLPDVDTRDGVPVRRIGPHGDRSPAGKWLMCPATVAWLVRHAPEYDVVCVVDYRGVGVAAVAARVWTGRPVLAQGQTTGVLSGVVEIAGVAPEGTLARLVKRPIRAAYRRADGFACISRVLEQEALSAGIPRARVHFLPNAIDMARFRPPTTDERAAARAALDLAVDAVVCVFVGRLSREKGILDLLEAWRLLQPTAATLVVAGPDMTGSRWNAGPAARSLVDANDLEASVRFLGPSNDVAGLLRIADVVVQPSHFEALGLSAVEALACGVPVVASAVGGLLDFVVEDINGRLVPAGRPDALAAALRPLLGDSAMRARLASAARASVSAYDECAVFGRMAALLSDLASRETA